MSAVPLRVLIAEDSPDDVTLLVRILRKGGFEPSFERVQTEDAMRSALLEKPWDLVLADYRMPNFDGLSAIAVLKESGLDIPLIIVSGTIGEEIAVAAMKAGASDYVMKGNLPRLIPAIERELKEAAVREEKKKAERSLRESEEKYRSLVENISDVIFEIDGRGSLTYISSVVRNVIGYEVEYLIGKTFLEFVHPEDRELLMNRFSELTKGVEYPLEYRIVGKSGEVRYVRTYTRPIMKEDTFEGARGTLIDITDRRRYEEAIGRERDQAEMYLDIAGVMLVALNAQGNITMMNRRGREILGYREDEIIGKNWFDFCLPTELRREVKSVFEKLMAGGIASVEYYENPVFTKDGEQRILEFHNTVVHDESGRIVGIFSSGEDVTERKKAEEDLKSSETRYRQLADVTFEGIIFHDEGVLLQANDQFFRMFGYEPDELVGNQIMEKTLTPDSREIVKAKIAERSTESYVATGLRKDGATLPIEVRARMREVGGKMVRATAIRDLSMLKNLEAQLLQAQKMEAIGTLAGGVAHDFNNLLQTVLGYSEFMLQRKKEGEPDYADLQKIYQAGKRGADLVKNLLTFSRRVDTHYLPIDLNQEITAVRGLLSRTIPKTININLHLGGNVEYIKADPSQIGQVLMNLAVNARDAMPDGGTLTIETTEIQLDEKYCNTYPEAKPGSYVLLTISDTGQGMDNETLSHIFEPFFSTKEVGKGTGLGLATVYGIVKQHQGRIICYSELGHGTTFKIYLPAIQTKKELETTTLEKAIAGGAETVLLVDDDADIRDLVATFLIEFGYSVITAVNGKEAVEIYQREGASISVIILDLIMPVMDGRQSLAQILRIDPKARVVIASGYSEGGTANGVMESGAKGFVQKPYNLLSAPFNGSER
jgi:PAS domain S-box-containing protein